MEIYLGADHGGFELKEQVKTWLAQWGHTWKDLGNAAYDEADDYPQFALAVGKQVAASRAKGVLACRSAGGMVIAANKVKGARAVNVFDVKSARHAREHNDANIAVLSGDWLSAEEAKEALKTFLMTEFTGQERHARRLKQIETYEQQ